MHCERRGGGNTKRYRHVANASCARFSCADEPTAMESTRPQSKAPMHQCVNRSALLRAGSSSHQAGLPLTFGLGHDLLSILGHAGLLLELGLEALDAASGDQVDLDGLLSPLDDDWVRHGWQCGSTMYVMREECKGLE